MEPEIKIRYLKNYDDCVKVPITNYGIKEILMTSQESSENELDKNYTLNDESQKKQISDLETNENKMENAQLFGKLEDEQNICGLSTRKIADVAAKISKTQTKAKRYKMFTKDRLNGADRSAITSYLFKRCPDRNIELIEHQKKLIKNEEQTRLDRAVPSRYRDVCVLMPGYHKIIKDTDINEEIKNDYEDVRSRETSKYLIMKTYARLLNCLVEDGHFLENLRKKIDDGWSKLLLEADYDPFYCNRFVKSINVQFEQIKNVSRKLDKLIKQWKRDCYKVTYRCLDETKKNFDKKTREELISEKLKKLKKCKILPFDKIFMPQDLFDEDLSDQGEIDRIDSNVKKTDSYIISNLIEIEKLIDSNKPFGVKFDWPKMPKGVENRSQKYWDKIKKYCLRLSKNNTEGYETQFKSKAKNNLKKLNKIDEQYNMNIFNILKSIEHLKNTILRLDTENSSIKFKEKSQKNKLQKHSRRVKFYKNEQKIDESIESDLTTKMEESITQKSRPSSLIDFSKKTSDSFQTHSVKSLENKKKNYTDLLIKKQERTSDSKSAANLKKETKQLNLDKNLFPINRDIREEDWWMYRIFQPTAELLFQKGVNPYDINRKLRKLRGQFSAPLTIQNCCNEPSISGGSTGKNFQLIQQYGNKIRHINVHKMLQGIEFTNRLNTDLQKIYAKKFRRRLENGRSVVTLQDCKDLVIFSVKKKLWKSFIYFFHTVVVNNLLKMLIIYFQYFLQIYTLLNLRKCQKEQKLENPLRTILRESVWKHYLTILRFLVIREYNNLIMGVDDSSYFYHTDKNGKMRKKRDLLLYEMLLKFSVKTISVALNKHDEFSIIENEINRLFRRNPFKLAGKDQLQENNLPECEKGILYGTFIEKENISTKEMINRELESNLQQVGYVPIKTKDINLHLIEAVLTVNEETYFKINIKLGILGDNWDKYTPDLRPIDMNNDNQLNINRNDNFVDVLTTLTGLKRNVNVPVWYKYLIPKCNEHKEFKLREINYKDEKTLSYAKAIFMKERVKFWLNFSLANERSLMRIFEE